MVEVMIAAAIMMMGISAAVISLQMGLNTLDTARSTTLVTQVLQDEAEAIRLHNWNELAALPEEAEFTPSAVFNNTHVDPDRFTFTRKINDLEGHADLKQIVLEADWRNIKGTRHQRNLVLHYSKGGIFDYYYGTTN